MKRKALILISELDGWEGLYVDGELVCQDHNLNDYGPNFWLEASERLGFKRITVLSLISEDDKHLREVGILPNKLSDLRGKYETD